MALTLRKIIELLPDDALDKPLRIDDLSTGPSFSLDGVFELDTGILLVREYVDPDEDIDQGDQHGTDPR